MDTKTTTVNGATIKRAIESRDSHMLSSFYADDALLRIVDRNNPPSKPREVKGRPAISAFWDDICSRAMTHEVRDQRRRGRPPRLQPGLHLSRRNESAVPRVLRSQGRQDRATDRRAGLGRVGGQPC